MFYFANKSSIIFLKITEIQLRTYVGGLQTFNREIKENECFPFQGTSGASPYWDNITPGSGDAYGSYLEGTVRSIISTN